MTDIETIRDYCVSKNGATECFPFDDVTLVFKVMDKMFAVMPLDTPGWLTLKCDPDYALELRDEFVEVEPAWHFNKRHWNQIDLNGNMKTEKIFDLIDHSYSLVVAKLPRSQREELKQMEM